MKTARTHAELNAEIETLRARLSEAEETLHAIRSGEVDALVVRSDSGPQVFTLRGANHSYRVLVEEMSEGALILTTEGMIFYANRRLAEILKTPLEQVIGAVFARWIAPADQAGFQALLQHRRPLFRHHQEMTLQASDGTAVPCYLSMDLLRIESVQECFCLVVTDLTEQKRSEAILAAERLARSILEQAAEAIVVCDPAGRIIRASEVAHSLCRQNPLGQPIQHAFPLRRSDGEPVPPTELIDAGQPRRVEAHLEREGAAALDLLINVGPLSGQDGEPLGSVVTLTDITQRKAAEQALREADRRKNAFLATLGHELRNPLAPISNACAILKLVGGSDPTLVRARELIDRQVGQLVRLVDDLLDISRITRDKLQLQREHIELATVLERALESARPAIEGAGQTLGVMLPPASILLEADPVRLAQVFVNLLNNACKFTPRGGAIRLSVSHSGAEALVEVTDTGRGVPAEHLPHLFEMFHQVPADAERVQSGLGIGLSLAQRLVQMHGGQVTAHSDGPGTGSTFRVRLPITSAQSWTAAAPAEAPRPRSSITGRVLVVDDQADVADSLATLLSLQGIEVQTASDGIEALAVAERFHPDLVLLDLGMPRLDGFETCRRMRAEPWGQALRIIAVTGWGQDADRERSAAAGFDAHWVKPVAPSVVLEQLAAECAALW